MNLAALAAKSAARPAGPAPKRARFDPSALYPTLVESLAQVRSKAREGISSGVTGVAVEVEIRVGMLIIKNERRWKETMSHFTEHKVLNPQEELKKAQDVEFKAGVDEIFAERLKELLSKLGFTGSPEPEQRLRLDGQGNRWIVDASGTANSRVENKQKFYRQDFALLCHEYDIRIDGARESTASGTTGLEGEQKLQSGWTQERVKRRVSYRSKERPSWKIDLTDVEVTLRGKGAPSSEMELEFELEHSAQQSWLQGGDDDPNFEKSQTLARDLLALLNSLIPHHLAAPREPELELVTEESLAQVAKLTEIIKAGAAEGGVEGGRMPMAAAAAAAGKHHHMQLEFIGSKPVNLLHKNLVNIRRKEYFATEKSDGTRYLLYVIEEAGSGRPVAVLMDQSRVIRRMRGGYELGRALGVGTVLDGELVFNRTFKESVFLVFDLLMLDHRPEVHTRFSARNDKIQKEVMRRCEGYLNAIAEAEELEKKGAICAGGSGGGVKGLAHNSSEREKHIKIVRKVFYAKLELGKLVDRMCFEDGERVYLDPPRRHHKSDGIIFQPDAPYKFSSDVDLLKWKWHELMTVDLQAVPLRKDSELFVALKALGPDNVTVDCTKRVNTYVGLGKFDAYRLLADLSADDPGGTGATAHHNIAEVAYDSAIGAWRYLRPRRDKERANHIDTVLGVFAEMAEAISVEELEYAVLQPAGQPSDFNSQLARMKKQLLDWQRDRQARRGK